MHPNVRSVVLILCLMGISSPIVAESSPQYVSSPGALQNSYASPPELEPVNSFGNRIKLWGHSRCKYPMVFY